jgi:phosphate uptake regulator
MDPEWNRMVLHYLFIYPYLHRYKSHCIDFVLRIICIDSVKHYICVDIVHLFASIS